ncbi:MAG: type 4a pilus biogenesis protein PilO [Thermodesulfovibrionales bacterium]|nr:type 4a pilus biogenesis protein PilO [Thermodesulfovibrionales bacterium]
MEFKLGFDIETLSPLKRKLLIILPALALCVLFYTLFIGPAIEENSKLEAEVKKENDEINLLKIHSAKLPILIKENEKLQRKLSELQLQLPEEREVSGLLKQVSILGVQAGLHVMTWKPRARVVHPSKEIYEIPVEVEMRGDFHNFGKFFSTLTKLNRIVNLNDINIKSVDAKVQKGPTGLDVRFITTTYSLLSEEDKKQLQAEEDKKVGKK